MEDRFDEGTGFVRNPWCRRAIHPHSDDLRMHAEPLYIITTRELLAQERCRSRPNKTRFFHYLRKGMHSSHHFKYFNLANSNPSFH